VAEEEKRRSRRRKSAARRGRTLRWSPLSLARIWVRREAEQPSVGRGERFMWGSSMVEHTVEREREKKCVETRKNWFFG